MKNPRCVLTARVMLLPLLSAYALSTPALATVDEDVRGAVFKIYTAQSPPNMFRPWEIRPPIEATGSGVLIEGGRILTNAHVVAYAQQIYVQAHNSSEKLDATVEYFAEGCDLATIQLDEPEMIAKLKPVPLASALPPMQAKVNVLGFPTGGDTLSVTEGVVSRIEFADYFGAAALRIQVDAAINPGNSGGPAIIDGKVIGLAFSRYTTGDNIGYLIPTEVIQHFLDDCIADEQYDGFPTINVNMATLENPSLRAYLQLDRSTTGLVIHRVNQRNLKDLLKPWDIMVACDGVQIDNLGMVPIRNDVRVSWNYLLAKKPPGATATLTIHRDGSTQEVEVPTITAAETLIRPMAAERPSYFIYGGLVFSPATRELVQQGGTGALAFIGSQGRLLGRAMRRQRATTDDELVVSVSPILPHKVNKGYEITPLSVLTHVNDTSVKNLRHLIQLVKEADTPFIVFRFEDEYEEKVVLDPSAAKKYEKQILRRNNIPAAVSDDLRGLWP